MTNSANQESEPDPVPQETRAAANTGNMLGRAAGGAVAGAMLGSVADPLTAIVGAAACAVLAATDREESEE